MGLLVVNACVLDLQRRTYHDPLARLILFVSLLILKRLHLASLTSFTKTWFGSLCAELAKAPVSESLLMMFGLFNHMIDSTFKL